MDTAPLGNFFWLDLLSPDPPASTGVMFALHENARGV